MDYIAFARKFAQATGIPVNLLKEGVCVYSTLGEVLGYVPTTSWTLYPPERNPEFSYLSEDLEYGHVQIEGTGYDLYLGPIFTIPATKELIRSYQHLLHTPQEYQEALTELLYQIPVGSHPHFIRTLLFLHLCLNGKEGQMEDFYTETEETTVARQGSQLAEGWEDREEAYTSTYAFEMELYARVRSGNTDRLKTYLEGMEDVPQGGRLAHSPLRQAKNTLIGLASKVSVLAAIPAGMDPDRTYQLVDLYARECEKLTSVEAVQRLQYIMLMDFCQRCSSAALPEDLSPEIFQAIGYIRNHTGDPLSVEEVAGHVHCSASHLMRRFKEETGETVGAFITRARMEDACEMLAYGDWSLAEISALLGFSSQSYFQNVFRRQYGMTPMQYRREHRGRQ